MRKAKAFLRTVLPKPVFTSLKAVQRRVNFARHAGFSDEERLIRHYLDSVPIATRYCVDIAAQDGVAGSQTVALFKEGWAGLAVECDAHMFAVLAHTYRVFKNVSLVRTRVIPDNVVSILKAADCPREFGFLSLDIDSYDYFVLERLLGEFRPSLICVEINEAVPPPLAFTVKYDPLHVWEGNHFQGQSISKCHELCKRFRYDIVELHYNNLFLVPTETNTLPPMSPEDAYASGYKNKLDRKAKFPWNADMEELLTLSPQDAATFINRKFAKYIGRYTLE